MTAAVPRVADAGPGRRLRPRLTLLALFLLPAAASGVLGVDVAFRGNGIDPFIYVGVVERLRDFVGRFPGSYYQYRFGYVLPEWLFERAFGQLAGYLALRFALLGAVVLLLHRRGRTPWAAAAGGLVVAASPLVQRALFTTYSESLSVAWLLVGVALALRVGRGGWRDAGWAAAAGGALGLSWNANFVTVTLLVVTGAVVAADAWLERWRSGRRAPWWPVGLGAAVAAGSAAVAAAGVVLYGVALDRWDVYGPTLRLAREKTAEVFLERSATWFTWRHYLLVLPVALVVGAAAWRGEDDGATRRALRRLWWITAGGGAVFAWMQWGRNGLSYSVYYYSSYPLALAVLLLAASTAAVVARVHDRRPAVVAAAAAVATVGPLAVLDGLKPRYLLVLGFAVVASVSVVAASGRRPTAGALVGLASVAWLTVSSPHDFPSTSPSFRVDPYYDRSLLHYSLDGFDVYSLARQYARLLPSLPAERGEIRVWFDGQQGSVANQVQSALVHYVSALQATTDPPAPEISPFVLQRLSVDRPRFVVVLDPDEADVRLGRERLLAAGQPYDTVWERTLRSGDRTVRVALLERAAGTWRDFPCPGPVDSAVPC